MSQSPILIPSPEPIPFITVPPPIPPSPQQEQSSSSEEKQQIIAPKRPKTPFFMFMDDKRQSLQNMSLGERGRRLGELWAQLSAEEKNEYKIKYDEGMKAYKEYEDAVKKEQAKESSVQRPEGYELFVFVHLTKYENKFLEVLKCTRKSKKTMGEIFQKKSADEIAKWSSAWAGMEDNERAKIIKDVSEWV